MWPIYGRYYFTGVSTQKVGTQTMIPSTNNLKRCWPVIQHIKSRTWSPLQTKPSALSETPGHCANQHVKRLVLHNATRYGRSPGNVSVERGAKWRNQNYRRDSGARRPIWNNLNETGVPLDAFVTLHVLFEIKSDETRKKTAAMVTESTVNTVKDSMAEVIQVEYVCGGRN